METKSWKINIQEIIDNYDRFVTFNCFWISFLFVYVKKIYEKINGEWTGKVLVLAGENSNYINRSQIPTYKEVFKNIDLEKDVKVIEKAGHWV